MLTLRTQMCDHTVLIRWQGTTWVDELQRETESKTWASGKERKCSQRDARQQRGRSELKGEASRVPNFRTVSGEGIKNKSTWDHRRKEAQL